MKLGDLSLSELRSSLSRTGVSLRTGPVVTRVRSRLPVVADALALHYMEHPIESANAYADFNVRVDGTGGLRRWFRAQAVFTVDGAAPFDPLPQDQAFPMLEWGLNWCVTTFCHQYLMLHAAVVEHDGRALILPAPPGSGKSTLCAGLVHAGWRLLSDELTIIDPGSLLVVPLPRPISLKNASIELIRQRAPGAAFSDVVRATNKGAVAHLRPPVDSVHHASEQARPGWVVLPRWQSGVGTDLRPLSKAQGLMRLIDNAFNFNVHGPSGFRTLSALIDGCQCFELTYSNLDDALSRLADLPGERTTP